jgi:hypothetical protein
MVALVVMAVTEATTVIVPQDSTMAVLLIHHPFPEVVVVILQVVMVVRDVIHIVLSMVFGDAVAGAVVLEKLTLELTEA